MSTEQRIRPAHGRPGTTRATMKAIVQDSYGDDADVLRLEEIDRPTIGDDEVLVRVHAAGVDRGVWHLMTGLPYPLRLMGYGFRAPANRVRGREVAGRVETVGRDVTTLRPDDEVFGIAEGSFAEYACARADKLAPKPKNLTFELAAVAGVSSLTALQAVRDRGRVQPGQKVLVVGASGGVGTFAVQIAKAFGADVTGMCSPAKVDMVRSLGADHVLDYTRDDIADGGRRYDVVIDTGGNRSLAHLRRALTPRGTLAVVGGETGGRWLGGIDRALRAPLLSAFVGQKLHAAVTSENAPDLIALRDLFESGKVTPVVDRAYPLSETPTAVRYMADGHARGKVVVTVSSSDDGTSSDAVATGSVHPS